MHGNLKNHGSHVLPISLTPIVMGLIICSRVTGSDGQTQTGSPGFSRFLASGVSVFAVILFYFSRARVPPYPITISRQTGRST